MDRPTICSRPSGVRLVILTSPLDSEYRLVEGSPYLVMELVEGLDLAGLYRARGQLPVSVVCAACLGVAGGLAGVARHGERFVRRDLAAGEVEELRVRRRAVERAAERRNIAGQGYCRTTALEILLHAISAAHCISPSSAALAPTIQRPVPDPLHLD